MDAILAQLQQLMKTTSSENPDTDAKGLGSRDKIKENNNHKNKQDEIVFHINEESNKIERHPHKIR